jgi:hypothetical protein
MRGLVAFLLLALLPAGALGSDAIGTGRFAFHAGPEGRKAAEHLARRADSLLEAMAGLLGTAPAGTVQVHIFKDQDALYREQPEAPRLPSWAAGAAWPEKNLIVLFLNRGDLDKTFLHELNHVLLGQAFKGAERVPRWLLEGLAVMWADEWSLQRFTTMTTAVLSGNTLPMDEIADTFPADLLTAEVAYCQSFYFISFLKREFGDAAFQRFIREYAKYKGFKAALRLAYRRDWRDIDGLWRTHLALHFSWLPLITSTSSVWGLATLLFLAGYARKKYQSRKTLQSWQQEEACRPDQTLH